MSTDLWAYIEPNDGIKIYITAQPKDSRIFNSRVAVL